MRKTIPIEKWKWFGMAGHFICSDRCLHHLCTQVGGYLISTVGNLRDSLPGGGLREARAIGCGRLYETFVFKAGRTKCDCGCGIPAIDGSEIDALPANDASTADRNHIKMCRKYSALKTAERKERTDG